MINAGATEEQKIGKTLLVLLLYLFVLPVAFGVVIGEAHHPCLE